MIRFSKSLKKSLWLIFFSTFLFFILIFKHKLFQPNKKLDIGESDFLFTIKKVITDVKTDNLDSVHHVFSIHEDIKVHHVIPNCGLPYKCSNGYFSISLFTGFQDWQYPTLCLDNKLILSNKINNCGRGINVVIIDSFTKSITRVANFDTFSKSSSDLESLLIKLKKSDILVMFSFDEASKYLSNVARLLLNSLGSYLAQNINYRSSWYLITNKGLIGFSPFEKINFSSKSSQWAKPFNLTTCLPIDFEGELIVPDESLINNKPKNEFCKIHDFLDWPLFCDDFNINDLIETSKLVEPLSISNELFHTPIVIILNHCKNNYFPLLLETLLRQPEINASKVVIFDSQTCTWSISSLIKVFGFNYQTFKTNISNVLRNIIEITYQLYPNANQVILIEDSVVLSPDFFPFMGQLLPLLHDSENKIFAISAWNENGFQGVSQNSSLVYRANATTFKPRFAAMFKRETNFSSLLSSTLWTFDDIIPMPKDGMDIIFPELSRVYFALPFQHLTLKSEKDYFVRNLIQFRSVSLDKEVFLKNIENLTSKALYHQSLIEHFKSSLKFYNLKDFSYFKAHKLLNPVFLKFSFVSFDNYQLRNYCDYFKINFCYPHTYVLNLGNVISFSFGECKNMALIIDMRKEQNLNFDER